MTYEVLLRLWLLLTLQPQQCPDPRHPSWCHGYCMVKRNACEAERKRLSLPGARIPGREGRVRVPSASGP